MATQHTVKAFDEEIGELRTLIAAMGGRAEVAITRAIDALTSGDEAAAAEIVQGDREIDRMEAEVERLAVRIIALRAPMANDLRDVVAALKIAGVVERIGDYAKNIAKRVPTTRKDRKIEPLSVLPAMAFAARDLVREALDAFAARDPTKAEKVCERDREIDDFYDSIFRALVTFMIENPPTISSAAHLLFVAKNLERIGDHATNIAEMVYYAATGEHMHERERGKSPVGQ